MRKQSRAARGGKLAVARDRNRHSAPARSPADDEALAKLAEAINDEHRQVQLSFKTGLLRVVRIGKLLHEAKARLGHGKWLDWIEQHTDLARRTVSRYMRISRILPTIPNGSLETHLRQCDVLRLPSPARRADEQPTLESPPTAQGPAHAASAAHEPPAPPGAGDLERFAAEVRRLIAAWPTGFDHRHALANCLETLAREVRATISLAG